MKTKIIFIIGVSGVGKSTIANLLSQELQVPFFDGDDFHPKKNIKKMSDGKPLNDADRYDWLQNLHDLAVKQIKAKKSCIIVCSALKQAYRDILNHQIEQYSEWIFLHGSFLQVKKRLDNRKNHFMSSELLKSQFDILETPANAIKINVEKSPEHIVEIIKSQLNKTSEFGLFGLGVMGKSLSRNLANNGIKLSLFNRNVTGKEENIALNFKNKFPELATALPFDDIASFVNSIQKPRKIMLMVNAGKTIDLVIDNLLPYLSEGDILIDGGNSNYNKTKERHNYLMSKNIHFIGAGVSGGEEGALHGPSIMPGGTKEIYKKVQPYLEKIAAKDNNNLPCCSYVGPEGSGHFVKMVHNGIEYAEMQLLAEVFTLLKKLGENPDEIATILESWKAIENSYLLEITIDILRKKEGKDWLIHKIMDKAGNKGTGNWTTIATAQLGVPSTMITSSLFARYTSFFKEERIALSAYFDTSDLSLNANKEDILKAYQFARIINHYQGFKLIKEASNRYNWNINLSELARIWTNGCIIRSDLMTSLVTTFKTADHILQAPEIIEKLQSLKPSIKKVVAAGIVSEVAIPTLTDAISFLNSFSKANSSANIIQAQRDYFGAHTYQRTDDASGKFYHTHWNEN
ncbi:NADP-dependent phosphogluconate dehydrogenase [uncultured Kordia sp.]|uniref:NADP-dependent phosphogluconate dehydrogenase n=1 Tax=uncultured Kordia sp. TaxID=507699 RepID=UPI002632CD3C|nr:NADP-dependent phosphogluconate dehydrogenase [uncultured Kordia sp.]